MANTTAPKIVDPTALPPADSEAELTPDQQRVKELEHLLAVSEGKKDRQPELVPQKDEEGKTVLIHFLEDGFTAQGQVWFRGQELMWNVDSPEYRDTKDRNGISWLKMTDQDQFRRFGKIFFRRGPWPGLGYDAIRPDDFPILNVSAGGNSSQQSHIEREAIQAAALKARNQRRMAPRMPR